MSDDMRVKDIMNELDRIILEVGKLSAQRDELLSALKELHIDTTRLCDRLLSGTFEDDCLHSLAVADAVIRKAERP